MDIYLDIQGVLLTNEYRPAHYVDEFLQFILANWSGSTYWLTSLHWKGSDRTPDILEPHLSKKTLAQLHNIKPTKWNDYKTDGINFKRPFLWFDDSLFPEEKEILRHYHALDCHRKVNLNHDPFQLLDEIVYLRSLA